MMGQTRMSPLTALFLGLFGVGAVGIASGTAIVLYGMRVIDTSALQVLGFAESTVGGTLDALPELLKSLPPAIEDLLDDRRAMDYTEKIAIDVNFVEGDRSGHLQPALTITNNGNEVVSMLAVHVAALDSRNVPIREWTEVVATPIAIDDDWRGQIYPGNTRYVILSGYPSLPANLAKDVTGAVEISQIRVWRSGGDS